MGRSNSKTLKIRRRNNGKKNHMVPSIDSIPKELVSEVLARVAAFSSTDFLSARLSCKVFNEVGEDNYVFHHVSLDKFPVIPWRASEEASSFLNKCRESGNPEALYRQGVVDYFSYMRLDSALECLKKAASSGHIGALYVLGIILLFHGDEFKQEGIQLLSGMKESKMSKRRVLKDCRENLKAIIRRIWIKNSIVLENRPVCCTMGDQHKKKEGWASETDEEDNYQYCQACTCDREVASICTMLPRSRVVFG
ncbi:unnamed protein product [Ilex paraguariensis]|uniref:At2g35280-like TPR domain-containing protein n=1 Tax=Ilex paraguariensis TaxID=185542 RepID=A0ABC8UKJ5_9AQUA